MAKRNIIIVSIILCLLIVLGGCTQTTQPEEKKVTTEKAEPIKIGVLIYPGFAPFFIAKEKGFFQKHGVEAEVTAFADVNSAISALAGGDVHMLFSSADFTTILVDSGIDVKEIFASDIGYGADGLVVKNDVTKVSELEGKTVYLDMGTPSHFLLGYAAGLENVNMSSINLVQMSADQVGTAFIAKKIDYGLTWEPWLSKVSERSDGKVLFTSKDKPGIITDTFVVSTATLNSRKADVKAVVKAWFDSIDYWTNNKADANAIMAKNLGLPTADFEAMVDTIKFLSYKENLDKFSKESDLNMYDLTNTAVKLYKDAGVIKSDLKPENVIDTSVLTELYQ